MQSIDADQAVLRHLAGAQLEPCGGAAQLGGFWQPVPTTAQDTALLDSNAIAAALFPRSRRSCTPTPNPNPWMPPG